MEITLEQSVVNQVARAINGGELCLHREVMEEKAQVKVIARLAFKKGQDLEFVDGADFRDHLRQAAENSNPVYVRWHDAVMADEEYARIVQWAFSMGKKA